MRWLTTTIRLDCGWLYVLAGLALCAAGVLVPARRDLEDLRRQRDRLADERAIGQERADAYETFLQLLADDDPALLRRLAAAQLNLVPADETPVLVAASRTATVTDWIDRNVRAQRVEPKAPPDTLLAHLVGGPGKLWVIAGGVLAVFVGLLLDDARTPAGHRSRPALPRWPVAPEARRRRRGPQPAGVAGPCGHSDLNPWYDQ
ncbi:MAG: hypothetical protein ACYSWT_12730 [Planctomycetota bacterium]|jgi:hypothetical protein